MRQLPLLDEGHFIEEWACWWQISSEQPNVLPFQWKLHREIFWDIECVDVSILGSTGETKEKGNTGSVQKSTPAFK
jgi:hypothetical protein